MKKSLIRWLSLLLLVLTVVGITMAVAEEPTPKAVGLVLEDMPIVLPNDASEVETTAASEMVAYLKKMTGKVVPVMNEGANNGDAIFIGATEFAKKNNVTYTDNNGIGEGWAIKAIGNSLVITGGETRGTLYGVYHLLEDHFGVRWWNMWEEYVPSMEDAVVPYNYDHSGEPVFSDRGIYSNEGMDTLYYVRNRLNGWTSNAPTAYGGERNFAKPYHVHTFSRFLPAHYTEPTSVSNAKWSDAMNPDRVDWFEVHPEWYAWMESRQERIDFGQFCMSSTTFIDENGVEQQGLLEALTERVLIAIEMSYEEADAAGKARPEYISITPNDSGGFCECADCRASLAASGPSGHLLKFVNKIAAVVAEHYPEMKVETLAYWQYFEVPTDDTVPADNVVIRLASSDIDLMHDLDHPNNVKANERLYKWASILKPGQLWYWDYGITGSNSGIVTNFFKYGPDWRKFYEVGGFGVFIEQQGFNRTDMWDLKHWVQTKLLEDPYQDEYELCKTFLRGYYGEAAADDLYNFLIYVTNESMDWDQEITYNYARFTRAAEWMDGNEALQAWQYFMDAEEKTKNDPTLSEKDRELFLNRINAARGGLDRIILYNHYRFSVEVGNTTDGLFDISRRDLAERYKEGLRWLKEMKNTCDHTGLETVNKRGSYNDVEADISNYKDLLDREDNFEPYNTTPNPPIPQQVYDDHPGISDAHIYDFPGHTIWSASVYGSGWEWIKVVEGEGAASYEGGVAVKYDQKEMVKRNVKKDDILSYYSFSETKPIFSNSTKKLYLGAPLIADGEYHLYRMEDIVVYTPAKSEISMFADSMLLSLGATMQHLMNKTVDVYVSMKIEGDPSFTSNDYGSWYVDRFIIVLPCEECDVVYGNEVAATCASNAYSTGKCPLCGKTVKKEVPDTKLDHEITGDFYYDEATGLYKAPCATCGTAEIDFGGKLPENLEADMKAKGASLQYLYMYDVDDFREVSYTSFIQVEDPDSSMQYSAKYSLAKEYEDGSLQYFEIRDDRPFRDLEGNLPGVAASEIIADGQYHLYAFKDVILSKDSGAEYHFFDWSLSVDFSKLPIKGQKVDLYISLKVEGELQFTDVNKLPNYYIDRMFIVGNCQSHVADTYNYDAATGTYTGICVNCGGVVNHEFVGGLPAEVVAKLEANGSDVAHAHVYGADDMQTYGDLTRVEDNDSVTKKAIKVTNYTAAGGLTIEKHPTPNVGTISYATLKANSGTGYNLYKFEGVKLPKNPSADSYYVHAFGWCLQARKMLNELGGRTVDLYISMKVVGDPAAGADFYVDQIIAVDDCSQGMSLEAKDLTVKVPASCGMNAIVDTKCTICRRDIKNVQLPGSMLDHDYSEDPNTCANCGMMKLPQIVIDDLKAKDMSVEHAHEYSGASNYSIWDDAIVEVEDGSSPMGKALKLDITKSKNYNNLKVAAGGSFPIRDGAERIKLSIPYATLKANSGKGYQIYKFENVTLPTYNASNPPYLWMFYWCLQNKVMIRDLSGHKVDLYISMKLTGDPASNAVYYVDRMIAVDTCDQYGDKIVYPGSTGTCQDAADVIGQCPVCGKENPNYVKPGTAGGAHSFTRYIQDEIIVTDFIAECDYGCGATDVKYRKALTREEELPAGFPEQSKNHIIEVYTAGEFGIHGEPDYYLWDPELDYPVGVRPCVDPLDQYLNMDASNGIELSVYVGSGTTKTPARIYASELKTNSGKGYILYSFEDIILMVERENHYFYMFKDWCVQVRMMLDDLEDYYQKPVDLFVYMKVEGDVTCSDPNNLPVYTVASIIVAEKCPYNAETMEVITPATCSSFGEAYGYCEACGKDVTTTIPKEKHNIVNPAISIAATCEYDEEIKGLCTVCGTVSKQEREGTKLEHEFVDYVIDENGVEYAFCAHGCGVRDFPAENNQLSSGGSIGDKVEQLPEDVQTLVPWADNMVAGAAGGKKFSFTDVTLDDWFYAEVKKAWERDLINGVTATEYRPNETLTRAQAIKLAAALNQMYFDGEVRLTNGAVNWYDSYVEYAIDNSIIDAKYADYSVSQMNAAITRSEFVAIFGGTLEDKCFTGWNSVADNAIPDVKMTDANAAVIYKFYRAGILTGSDGAGTFNPDSSIKRSEVAAILIRMFEEGSRQSVSLG